MSVELPPPAVAFFIIPVDEIYTHEPHGKSILFPLVNCHVPLTNMMTGVIQGTRFSCALTVTVIPTGIITVSPHVGFLPNDHVPAVPQFPVTEAEFVTAIDIVEYN